MILPVQVLRAAAAFAIVVLHGLNEAGLFAAATGRVFTPPPGLPWGAGVDVFFVVSGFVMVLASAGLFGRPGARRVFLARRVARVVPLYWLVTTAYLALALAAPSVLNTARPDPAYAAASYLFVPAARPDGSVQPLYGLGWTLNYEMAFYGLFAVALGLPRRAAVPALTLVLLVLAVLGSLSAWPQPFGAWTDPIVLEFALGLVLGLWRVEGVRIGYPARVVLAVAALMLLVALGGAEVAGWSRAILWGVPAACLVAACGLGHDDPWTGEGRLERAGAALGDASYALYLVHPFALRGMREALRLSGLAPSVPPWLFFLAALVGSVALALATHRWIERPLTAAVRRLLEGRALSRSGGPRPPRPTTGPT